jgi:poly-gamma-glutamate synthesis protein (capsule biosynthesis protein)
MIDNKSKIILIAVGDMMLGDQHFSSGFGVASQIEMKGTEYLFKDVANILKTGNIVFGNLECTISASEEIVGGKKHFIAPRSVLNAIRDAGFTVLSVSNNHTMQNGVEQFKSTVSDLKKVNILPIGIKNETAYQIIEGRKVVYLSYSLTYDKTSVHYLYNQLGPESHVLFEQGALNDQIGIILSEIHKAKIQSDFLIISLHWGLEYVPYPSLWQVETARKFIDAGADVILGCHAHVLQGYEIYNGKTIIYGMGNFIFDQTFNPNTRKSAIFEIQITDSLPSVTYYPILIDKNDYHPILLSNTAEDKIQKHIEFIRSSLENKTLEEYSKVIVAYPSEDNPYQAKAVKYMYSNFIRNIFKYSPRVTFLIIKMSILRRLHSPTAYSSK